MSSWLQTHAFLIYSWLERATPYIALCSLLLALVVLVLLVLMHKRVSRLMLGRTGSLEETLSILSREMKEMKEFRSELEKYLKLVELRLRGSVSGIGVVRFNPFSGDGSGGNQSFAVAFLDEKYSGVVFSSLYARDRVAIYGKPIERGASSFELTREEKEAIERAKKTILERTPK